MAEAGGAVQQPPLEGNVQPSMQAAPLGSFLNTGEAAAQGGASQWGQGPPAPTEAAPAPRRAAPAAHKATVQPSVVPFASGRKGYYEDMRAEAHAERFTRARHPLADRMFDEALQSHYNMRSSTFGLEH